MPSAIQTAQAPPRFTLAFLENLGYKSSSDRLIIGVLKALGFLNADGAPTERYYRYLDQTESPRVMADALRDAYEDLFQLNRNAHTMSRNEVRNKFRTLSQGQYSDDVVNKMAGTFTELAKYANFDAPTITPTEVEAEDDPKETDGPQDDDGLQEGRLIPKRSGVTLDGSGLQHSDPPAGIARSGCLRRTFQEPHYASAEVKPGEAYEFVFRGILTEEALDRAGRRHRRIRGSRSTDRGQTRDRITR